MSQPRHCVHCRGLPAHCGCPVGCKPSLEASCWCKSCGTTLRDFSPADCSTPDLHLSLSLTDLQSIYDLHKRQLAECELRLQEAYNVKMKKIRQAFYVDQEARNKILFRKTLKLPEHIKNLVLSFLSALTREPPSLEEIALESE